MSVSSSSVPAVLRGLFVLHFWIDMAFALPLFFAPEWFLGLLGWTCVDPSTSRIVAAALFAIGIQSWLGRDEPPSTFRAMLTLKVIWSTMATLGLLISAIEGGPPMTWALAAFWALFCGTWWTWRLRLG